MPAQQGFAGGESTVEYSHEGRISDMDVVNRERTTVDPYASGAAGDPSKFDTLIYPLDLNPENFFPEAICFQVKKRVGLSLEEVVEAVGDTAGELIDALNPMSESRNAMAYSTEIEKEVSELKKNGVSDKVLQDEAKAKIRAKWIENGKTPPSDDYYEDVIASGKLLQPFSKSFGALKGKVAAQRALTSHGTTANTLGNIYMNMPNQIQFSEAANWDPTSLGWVGAIKNTVGEAFAGGIAGQAGNITAAAFGGSMGYLMKLLRIPHAGGMLGGLVAAVSEGSKIQHGIESAMSMAQNPYMEMMFQGVGFRKFTFNFVMRPRNLEEVQQVMGILKMFRLHSRPSWSEGMLGHGFMKYPMEFHISFLTLESGSARVAKPNKIATNVDKVYTVNQHIPKIKPCVCTNVETNYTPQSIWTAYKGGNPVAVNLGLSFSETELVMADDVEKGW